MSFPSLHALKRLQVSSASTSAARNISKNTNYSTKQCCLRSLSHVTPIRSFESQTQSKQMMHSIANKHNHRNQTNNINNNLHSQRAHVLTLYKHMLRAAADHKPHRKHGNQNATESNFTFFHQQRPHPEVIAARNAFAANTRISFKMRKLVENHKSIQQHIDDAKNALKFLQALNGLPEESKV
jgi:hypothetical protein